ncbi:MAG: hypothetical protein QM639_13820 [Rhodocyclaceae bacterium]
MGQAFAQADVAVSLEVVAIHVQADGTERVAPAAQARPDDILEYRATYRNRGTTTARQVQATLPVPAGQVSYVMNAAQPRQVRASVDGRVYDAPPLKRTVVGADGRRKEESVPLSEYRSLRWDLGDIAPGASKVVSARVRVNPLSTSGG